MREEQGNQGSRQNIRDRNLPQNSSTPVSPYGSLFSLIFRVIVGGVLIYSGVSKAIGPTAEFAAAISAYRLLPADWVYNVAAAWPWIELLVGTYLFFGYFTRRSAQVSSALFFIFLSVLVSSMVRGIDPGSCGCFGAGISLSIRQTAILDTVLLILSIVLAQLSKTPPLLAVDSWINR